MLCDAVFEGGGMRGIGFVGALSYLEKKGFKWRNVAGTSAGAIIASLLAAGYTAKEIEKILVETDFLKFLDKEKIQKIPILGKPIGFFSEKGIYSGNFFENWMEELLNKKGVSTFKDLCNNNQCKLKLIASDITRKEMLILPDALSSYGINPLNFKISKAVRMSMSIPFYFKPVTFKYHGGVSYIVDGGICWNYPISIFDNNKDCKKIPTIGFKFKTSDISYTAKGKTDAMSFLFDIADTMSAETNGSHLCNDDINRTIFIPALDVDTTEFDIPKEKSLLLFKSGYRAAKNFVQKYESSMIEHEAKNTTPLDKAQINNHLFKNTLVKIQTLKNTLLKDIPLASEKINNNSPKNNSIKSTESKDDSSLENTKTKNSL